MFRKACARMLSAGFRSLRNSTILFGIFEGLTLMAIVMVFSLSA